MKRQQINNSLPNYQLPMIKTIMSSTLSIDEETQKNNLLNETQGIATLLKEAKQQPLILWWCKRLPHSRRRRDSNTQYRWLNCTAAERPWTSKRQHIQCVHVHALCRANSKMNSTTHKNRKDLYKIYTPKREIKATTTLLRCTKYRRHTNKIYL